MNDLKMELAQLNEAIDMITMMLDKKDDPQLVEQLAERLKERDELIKKINALN